MLTRTQVPYTGPYSNAGTKLQSSGATVIALKRALSRMGRLEWKGDEFTPHWPRNGAFDNAFRKWQRDLQMPGDGVYGEQEWKAFRSAKVPQGPKKGQYALDKFAQSLIKAEWEKDNVPDESDVRAAITTFCLKAEANEDNWHYRLARPLDVTVEPNASYIVSDCSMFVIQCFNWAGRQSKVAVPDPSKMGYSGYGNTDQDEDGHPRVTSGNYLVGDLAHYAGHVTCCRRAGTSSTAIFTSHGQEAGPIPASLHYRSDLRFVVRPPLMP